MKNKMLFLVTVCGLNLLVNLNSMDFAMDTSDEYSSQDFHDGLYESDRAMTDSYLNQDMWDEILQIKKCMKLIRAHETEKFIKYFTRNRVNPNITFSFSGDSEDSDEDEKEENENEGELSIKDRRKTFLMVAVEENCMPIIEFLVSKQADINLVRYYKMTALTIAVFANNVEAARFLIKNGANVNFEAQFF